MPLKLAEIQEEARRLGGHAVDVGISGSSLVIRRADGASKAFVLTVSDLQLPIAEFGSRFLKTFLSESSSQEAAAEPQPGPH